MCVCVRPSLILFTGTPNFVQHVEHHADESSGGSSRIFCQRGRASVFFGAVFRPLARFFFSIVFLPQSRFFDRFSSSLASLSRFFPLAHIVFSRFSPSLVFFRQSPPPSLAFFQLFPPPCSRFSAVFHPRSHFLGCFNPSLAFVPPFSSLARVFSAVFSPSLAFFSEHKFPFLFIIIQINQCDHSFIQHCPFS